MWWCHTDIHEHVIDPSVRLKCKFFISDSCQFVKNLSMFYQQCAVQQKWFKGFLLRHFIIFNERTNVCFCKGMNQLNNRVTHIPAILQWYIIIHLHLSNIHNTQYDHWHHKFIIVSLLSFWNCRCGLPCLEKWIWSMCTSNVIAFNCTSNHCWFYTTEKTKGIKKTKHAKTQWLKHTAISCEC